MDKPKTIKVTCAIIESSGQILAAQRSESMGMALKWEFPGGKIEPGESAEDCIARELKEELDIDVDVKASLPEIVHDYGTRTIELIPFICEIKGGNLTRREHKQFMWGKPEKLSGLDWAEADVKIYKEYMGYLKGGSRQR